IALDKRSGKDWRIHYVIWNLLRKLQPAIVHTRNLSAMEYAFSATLAGVPRRIHGEHGRDIYDIDGLNPRYNFLRRALKAFIHHYDAVIKDLENWLVRTVGIPAHRVAQIYNGVDAERFQPRAESRSLFGPVGFCAPDSLIIGTVGRMQPIKDPLTLVRA